MNSVRHKAQDDFTRGESIPVICSRYGISAQQFIKWQREEQSAIEEHQKAQRQQREAVATEQAAERATEAVRETEQSLSEAEHTAQLERMLAEVTQEMKGKHATEEPDPMVKSKQVSSDNYGRRLRNWPQHVKDEIKSRHKAGEPINALAAAYKLGWNAINMLCNPPRVKRGMLATRNGEAQRLHRHISKWPPEVLADVKDSFARGESRDSLVRRFGVSASTISRIVYGSVDGQSGYRRGHAPGPKQRAIMYGEPQPLEPMAAELKNMPAPISQQAPTPPAPPAPPAPPSSINELERLCLELLLENRALKRRLGE